MITPVGRPAARFVLPPALQNEARPPEAATAPPDLVSLAAAPVGPEGPSLKAKLLAATALGVVALGGLAGATGYTLRHAAVCTSPEVIEACVPAEYSVGVNHALRGLQGLPFRAANAEDLASHQSRVLQPDRPTSRRLQDDLSFLSWNLHHGDSSDATGARPQIEPIIRELNARPADLHLLQEVSPWHAQRLVDGTGMVGYYTQTQLLQGNLILVHPDLPVSDNLKTLVNMNQPDELAEGYQIAENYIHGGTEPRAVQVLRLQLPDGNSALVWNTHLMNGGDAPPARLAQADRALDFVEAARRPGERVLGGGDFNSPRGSQVYGELQSRFEEFSGDRIDFWMESGFPERLVTQAERPEVDGVPISDHPLVWGTLQPS